MPAQRLREISDGSRGDGHRRPAGHL